MDSTHKYVNHSNKIRKAMREGKLIKPKQCSQCKRMGIRINAHHEDYTKPLDIIWLCSRCHICLHHNIPFDDYDFEIGRVMIKGIYYYFPRLKKEPYQLRGLLIEDSVIDNHEYYEDYSEWDEIFKILTRLEREVVKLHYGFSDGYEHTFREISTILRLSLSYIHNLETNAIRKLKRHKGVS